MVIWPVIWFLSQRKKIWGAELGLCTRTGSMILFEPWLWILITVLITAGVRCSFLFLITAQGMSVLRNGFTNSSAIGFCRLETNFWVFVYSSFCFVKFLFCRYSVANKMSTWKSQVVRWNNCGNNVRFVVNKVVAAFESIEVSDHVLLEHQWRWCFQDLLLRKSWGHSLRHMWVKTTLSSVLGGY